MKKKSGVRSVKGKTRGRGQRPATPKIASNKARNKPPKRIRHKIDAIPAKQNLKFYEQMRGK